MATAQILMATHDPLVVAGLLREQVLLLEQGDDGRIRAGHPDRDPRGMGVAALLTSEVYGLRSQLDLATQELLDEKRRLASQDDRTSEDDHRLAELSNLVGDVDIAASARDPLYRAFVEAMSARHKVGGLAGPDLSREEIRDRERIASEVFAELSESGEQT